MIHRSITYRWFQALTTDITLPQLLYSQRTLDKRNLTAQVLWQAALKYFSGIFAGLSPLLLLSPLKPSGMVLLSLYILISYFFLDCCVVLGQVLQNRTFDDNDPAIRYTGQWSVKFEAGISLNTGGAHMYTQDPNAQAAFKFTGKSVVVFKLVALLIPELLTRCCRLFPVAVVAVRCYNASSARLQVT